MAQVVFRFTIIVNTIVIIIIIFNTFIVTNMFINTAINMYIVLIFSAIERNWLLKNIMDPETVHKLIHCNLQHLHLLHPAPYTFTEVWLLFFAVFVFCRCCCC